MPYNLLLCAKLNYAAVWCSLQHICAFHIPCTFIILCATTLHFLYLFLLCIALFIFLVSLHLLLCGGLIVSNLHSVLSIAWFTLQTIFGGSVIHAVHFPCHGSPCEPDNRRLASFYSCFFF